MARSFLNSILSSDESSTPSLSSDEDQGLHPPVYRRKKTTRQRPLSPSSLPSTSNEICHDDLEHGAWNTNYAVVYLIDHLRNSSSKEDDDVTSAAQAIALARTYPVPPRQWRRYPALIFATLSDAVFDGKLSDEQGVKVGWERMDEGVSGRTVLLGQEGGVGVEVKVELNATALQSANRDEIVGTLLHHMIHAYLLVVCGGNDRDPAYCHEEEDQDGREDEDENGTYDHLAHGHAFASILWEIRLQAAKGEADGERPLPIGFGHRLPSAFSKFMTDRAAASCASASTLSTSSTRSRSNTSASKSTQKGSNATTPSPRHPRNCSHCPARVPTISLDASKNWYTTECAPFLSAPPCMRGKELYACTSAGDLHPVRRGSTSSYVELIHGGDKPIGIPRGVVEQFESLAALFSNGKCWVELPRTIIGRKELGALMTFLKTRSYRPVLKPRGRGHEGDSDEYGRVGGAWTSPPIIKARTKDKGTRKNSHTKGGEPEPTTHLLHDIRVYHLASALGFTELVAYSLHRLYAAQPFTYENPLNLVEAIYFPGTGKMQRPHQLRAWARSFLSRRDEAAGGVSNMAKLETDAAWKRRWNGLLARGGEHGRALLEDVRIAYMEEVVRRQHWRGRPQYSEMPRTSIQGQPQHLYAQQMATGNGRGHVDENPDTWPNERSRYDAQQYQSHLPQAPLSATQTIIPQQFSPWWGGPQYHYPYPYAMPVAPPPAPFYPYYQSHPPQQQPQMHARPACNNATTDTIRTAATATSKETVAATRRKREAATANLGDEANERCNEVMEELGSDNGACSRGELPKPTSGRGASRLPFRRRHPGLANGVW